MIKRMPIKKSSERAIRRGSRRVRKIGEALRQYYEPLLCRLKWPGSGPSRAPRTVGVTSCYCGEGVSTVAAQLALTAATYSGHKVLLVDANLARPSAHRTFGVDLQPGLVEILMGGHQRPIGVHPSVMADLSVLAAGKPNGSAAQSFGSDSLSDVLAAMKEDFDLVVVDLPAAIHESPAIRLAGLLDGVLLVVQAKRVRCEVAQRMKELLEQADVNLVGAVLNAR